MLLITNKEYSKEEFDKRLRYKTIPVARVTEELKDWLSNCSGTCTV